MAGKVDIRAVYAALDHQRESKDMSWRQVAKEAGVSPSTLSRMAQGHTPALDGLVRLADWAGTSLDELMGRRADTVDREGLEPPAAIASYLRTRKELSKDGVEAIEAIVQAAYDKLRDNEE